MDNYFNPYGAVTVYNASNTVLGSSAYAMQYLHQGGRLSAESGLYYFRNRDYSATLGGWVSLDPIRFQAGDVNLYRYVGNAPILYLDYTGLWSIENQLIYYCWHQCISHPHDLEKHATAAMVYARNWTKENGYKDGTPEERALRHCIATAYLVLKVGCECGACLEPIS